MTPAARAGLTRLTSTVAARFGATTARRVLDEFTGAFERIAAHPGIGHERRDFTRDPDIRFWLVGPALVAYRPRPDALEILLVERGEMDWRRLLSKPPE